MIMSIMAGSERTVLGVSGDEEGNFNNGHHQNGDQQIPFDPFANGQELNVGINIINQYGELVGEYNRLDDELWFSKPEDDDEAMDGSNQGLDCNFVSTYEHTLDLEKPSRSVDNAVCDGGTVTGKERSSSLRDSSQDQSQTSSPVSVLQRRSYSNALTRAIKHARDKFHCPVKGDSHKDLCSLGTAFVVTEQSESFQCESYVESHVLDVMEEEIPSKHQRMKKISDLLQAGSGESNQNPDPKPIPKEVVKKCLHCESTKTPQWRDGPKGKGTLCNACGVQYKKGSLLPDYRPLRSPTFDPTLHTNLVRSGSRESGCNHNPKPIPKQKRPIKAVKKCLHCESTKTPNCRRGPMKQTTPCDAYGVQYKKARFSSKDRSLRSSTSDSSLHSNVLQSGSKENDQDPDPKQILMQKRPLKAVKKCLHCGSTKTPQWRDGPLGKATLCNACGVQYKKAILPSADHSLESSACDSSLHFNMLQSISGENDENPDPKSIPEEKHPLKAVKKCLHCESTKTPQWRDGPLGKRTLCNACGVQYRHGRLFPEYRPLKSPTFDPSLHSSLPKKVQRMRMSMIAAKGASSEKGRQPT